MVAAKTLPGGIPVQTLTVEEAQGVLYRAGVEISREYIQEGLREGLFPFGMAIQMNHYKYIIFKKKLADFIREYTGLEAVFND